MNLMDMLSGDTPDSIFQNNDPQDMQSVLENAAPSGLEYGTNGGAHPIQTNDGVYHLPTILTKVQCELAEFVLQVLNPVLLAEAHSKRQRASINSLLDNNTNDNSGMTEDASKEGEGNISKKNLIHPSDKLEKFGYADYKKKIAELLNNRVLQLEHAILEKFEKDIPSYRLRESLRQTTLDTKEDSVAEKYKVLQKLNEDATISEKKLLRVDNDLQKLENTNTELNDKLKYLNSAIKQVQESEEKLPEFATSQEQQLKELDLELTKLDDEYSKINEENEKIRANYQNSSSEAVQLSTSLVSWKEEKTHLSKKLNGPGIKLIPSLIQKDELINYESELTKLTRESDFVNQFFTKKLDKLIKDRTTILDNTTSGSSSRPGNRISRGSTPF
ncbi:hypothetical protein QCA50_013970 [Cerrena zonata]|uniref:Uncharacterized protein n=1 Tax=Cerrena zonata TaxID=2478898 RepID=A0AAW0FUF6_9APHY